MSGDDHDLAPIPETCRLFPLPRVVLFPHAILPLHIFEPRYRRMTEDALAGDRLIAMVQSRPDAAEIAEGEPAIEPVACLGRIVEHLRLPDGRYNLLLQGKWRVRVLRELEVPKPYRVAEIHPMVDVAPDDPTDSLRVSLVGQFRRVCRGPLEVDRDLARFLEQAPSLAVLTDLLAHYLGMPPEAKQSFLAEVDVERRAQILISLLRRIDGPDRPPGPEFPPPFSAN